MSLLDKITPKQQPQTTPLNENNLTLEEIEIVLSMMKRTTFLGEDIEPLYNIIIKLQNQYINLSK
jgi:hypothetical protein